MTVLQAYRDLPMNAWSWVLARVLPVGAAAFLTCLVLLALFPGQLLTAWGVPLLFVTAAFVTVSALLWPYVLRERRRHEIDDELHLFIIKIAVLSLSSSTRASIFEIASREKSYKTIVTELLKVRELSKEWKVSIPHALRLVSKQTPSRRLSDFLERMAYAMETDEDPKVFFRNEQDAVMEEFKSRYTNTLDRLEVVREVYISMVSVTMFLNVLLVVMSLLVGINHYLMSFLIVFIFLVVEIVLWMVINGVLPKEHIWYDPKPYPRSSSFHRSLLLWTVISGGASALIASMLLLFPLVWENTILYLAIASTPLILPGIMVLREQSVIVRRDDAFGAFIRTIGSTSESKGGSASMGLRRLRWHDFGPLTKQVRDLYDRLRLRIDSDKAWALFARESRSELISQFLGTYHEGISAGGSPKEVSTMISGHFTTMSSLRKRRYLMADNFSAILYSLTVFISGGLFMTYKVVLEILARLEDLQFSSSEIERFQSLVLLKDVKGLETVLLLAILTVLLLHVVFSADAARRFKGGHPMALLVHLPLLLWTAAAAAWLASFAVGRIL